MTKYKIQVPGIGQWLDYGTAFDSEAEARRDLEHYKKHVWREGDEYRLVKVTTEVLEWEG